jgi:hypothetical protein
VVEVHPLNLAIVAASAFCDPTMYAGDPLPDKCQNTGFHYDPASRTLFVPQGKTLEILDLPEGAAVHLCRTTPDLHRKGCGATLLNPYWDKIEAEVANGGPNR